MTFPTPKMFGSKGGGDAVSLNGNPLPRVDVAENGLRERQHCPWREEFFKLIAILPREGRAGHLPAPTVPLHAVLARIGRAAKRGCKYTDAGVAAAQLFLPKIHEIETRRDPDPLRAQDRQQTMVMVAPGHLPRFIAQTPHRLFEMNPGDMGGLAEKRECGAHLSSWAGRPLERPRMLELLLTEEDADLRSKER